MIMKKKGILLAITWAYTFVLHAQDYTFGLQPENTKPDRIETVSNGATRFVFPAGTDLNQLGLEAVLPEGATVFPDPATARIRDNEPEIFTVTYADGTQKAFPYYFTAGRWFSVVLFGDPEINLTDRTGNNAKPENLSRWADGIIHMANSYGQITLSLTAHITFLKAVSEGWLYAEAREVYHHSRIPYIEVRISQEDGTPVAIMTSSGYRKKDTLPVAPLTDTTGQP